MTTELATSDAGLTTENSLARLPTVRVQVAQAAMAQLGEGPLWDHRSNQLWWVDIAGKTLNRLTPSTHVSEAWPMPSEPACMALAGTGLWIAMRDGLYAFDPRSEKLQKLSDAPYNATTTRYNDGRCDPQGRFWAGTVFEPKTSPEGALYRFDASGQPTRIAGGVLTANGLAFSPCQRWVYWADTPKHCVWRFAFDPVQGTLSDQTLFHQFPIGEGRPDGAACDRDGNYWTALYEGGAIVCLTPDGIERERIDMPARCPTMLAFGGVDYRTVFVTSARKGRSIDELQRFPLSGSVFSFTMDTPGLPEPLVRAEP